MTDDPTLNLLERRSTVQEGYYQLTSSDLWSRLR